MTPERKKFIAKFCQDIITGIAEGVLFILLTLIVFYLTTELLSFITNRRFI